MNGFELIKILKSKNINCKANIIILTNYGKKDLVVDKKFLESLGINKYLVKSNYTKSEIFTEIENSLV